MRGSGQAGMRPIWQPTMRQVLQQKCLDEYGELGGLAGQHCHSDSMHGEDLTSLLEAMHLTQRRVCVVVSARSYVRLFVCLVVCCLFVC